MTNESSAVQNGHQLDQKTIFILDEQLILHERFMQDVLNLNEFLQSNGNGNMATKGAVYHASMISDALKLNWLLIKPFFVWYMPWKWGEYFRNKKERRRMQKITSIEGLLEKLGVRQLVEYAKEVHRLEGYSEDDIEAIFNPKKKMKLTNPIRHN